MLDKNPRREAQLTPEVRRFLSLNVLADEHRLLNACITANLEAAFDCDTIGRIG
jgi:hypothetical protein